MIKPLFGNVLIEVMNEYDGVVGATTDNVQKGYLRAWAIMADHLTTSTGYEIQYLPAYDEVLNNLKDKVVYWQEYADAGSKFKVGDKEYVSFPFYRLTNYEESE